MAGRTVTVTLYHSYGHPDNNMTRGQVLKVFATMLPKVIAEAKGQDAENPVWFKHYEVVSIEVQ